MVPPARSTLVGADDSIITKLSSSYLLIILLLIGNRVFLLRETKYITVICKKFNSRRTNFLPLSKILSARPALFLPGWAESSGAAARRYCEAFPAPRLR